MENITEKTIEERQRWLENVERKTAEDVAMRTRKIEVSGHRKTGTQKTVAEISIQRYMKETVRKIKRPKNIANKNSIHTPHMPEYCV